MPKDKSPVHNDIAQVIRLILKIEFGDNFSTMLVKSDNTWDIYSSHIEDNSIYNGEVYDATTSTERVQTSVETTGPAGEMYLPLIPYIAETGKVDKPVKIYRLKCDPEKQVVDFGNNTAGIVKLKVEEVAAGQEVQTAHAEVLQHPPYGKDDGSLYYVNLREADQLDRYLSNGSEDNYKPTFTIMVFVMLLSSIILVI